MAYSCAQLKEILSSLALSESLVPLSISQQACKDIVLGNRLLPGLKPRAATTEVIGRYNAFMAIKALAPGRTRTRTLRLPVDMLRRYVIGAVLT